MNPKNWINAQHPETRKAKTRIPGLLFTRSAKNLNHHGRWMSRHFLSTLIESGRCLSQNSYGFPTWVLPISSGQSMLHEDHRFKKWGAMTLRLVWLVSACSCSIWKKITGCVYVYWPHHLYVVATDYDQRSNKLMTRPWEFKSGAFWEIKPDMISRERSAVPLDSNNSSKTLGGTSVTSELKTGIFPFTVNVKIGCQTAKMTLDIRSHLLLLSRARIHLQKMMNNSVHTHFTTVFWLNPGCWMSKSCQRSCEHLKLREINALKSSHCSYWKGLEAFEAKPDLACISMNSVPRKSSKSLSSLLTIIFHDLLRNHLLTRVKCTWTWQSNAVRVMWQTFSCEVFVCLSDQKSTSAVPCHQL